MSSAQLGTTPLGSWPVDLSSLQRTTDRDFLTGLIHTVSLEWDANSVGTAGAAHAGRPARWVPVEGFEAIACRVVLKRSIPMENGAMRVGRVLFGVAIVADQRFSLLFTSNGFGTIRLYFVGPVIDAHEMGHHWYCDVTDRPN